MVERCENERCKDLAYRDNFIADETGNQSNKYATQEEDKIPYIVQRNYVGKIFLQQTECFLSGLDEWCTVQSDDYVSISNEII